MENESEIIRDAFGLWISGLFGSICGKNPNASFSEKKEYFFFLLEKLLRERKIIFIAPGADCYVSPTNPNPKLTVENPQSHWNASVDEIVSYIKNRWPIEVNDENDIELTCYFYDLPGIIWIREDGKLVAS